MDAREIDRTKFDEPECRTYSSAYDRMLKHAVHLEDQILKLKWKLHDSENKLFALREAVRYFEKAKGRFNSEIAMRRILELGKAE